MTVEPRRRRILNEGNSYNPEFTGVDPVSGATIKIDFEHHEIHEGDHFFYNDVLTLANGATQDYLLTTPNTTKRVHFLYHVNGTIGATIGIYEGANRTGTTLQTAYNSDRDSSNTATIIIHKGQSGGTTDGTNIAPNGFGSSTVGGGGGESTRAYEILLKKNTKYIFRVTNKAAVNNDLNVKFIWYEHTPAN